MHHRQETDAAGGTAAATFYRDVLPILQSRCQQCHREGEIAPFALKDYDEVGNWAETIKEVVLEKRMPPWTADPAHGDFVNDPRLTPEECHARRGRQRRSEEIPADKPAEAAVHRAGWNIGTPDAVYSMPKPFKVKGPGERCRTSTSS